MAESSRNLPHALIGETEGGETIYLFVQPNGALAFSVKEAPPNHADVWYLGMNLPAYQEHIALFEYPHRYAILATTLSLPREGGPVNATLQKHGSNVQVTLTFGKHTLHADVSALAMALNTLRDSAQTSAA